MLLCVCVCFQSFLNLTQSRRRNGNLCFPQCILSTSLHLKWVVNGWLIASKKKNKKGGDLQDIPALKSNCLVLRAVISLQWQFSSQGAPGCVRMNASLLCVCMCASEREKGECSLAPSARTCKEKLKLKRQFGRREAGKKNSDVQPASSCVPAWEKVTGEPSVCKSPLIKSSLSSLLPPTPHLPVPPIRRKERQMGNTET